MKEKMKKKSKYIAPQMTTVFIAMEEGIAAGSANINTGSDSQTPQEREFESGWSNNRDMDL